MREEKPHNIVCGTGERVFNTDTESQQDGQTIPVNSAMSLHHRSKDSSERDEASSPIYQRGSSDEDDDNLHMRKMGYEPSLHRGLDAFMNFAIGLSEVAVFVSISMIYGAGLIAGGPMFMSLGFLLAFVMSAIASLSMAEICSAYPSAGSVYHWAGQLCPVEDAALWSYICGWANFLGNFAGDAGRFAGSLTQP